MLLSSAPRRAFRSVFNSRPLSSSTLLPNHQIYISKSTNPYFNLSLEDWLFRHAPKESPLLLLYRDAPCVVLGRHQNPWRELSPRALREAGIPLVRRRSGGGAVYHDLGNTNFSIHLPREKFDRHATAQIPLRALHALGVTSALVNKRGDIVVRPPAHLDASSAASSPSPNCTTEPVETTDTNAPQDAEDAADLKVSGSAYKITSGRAYHHGTMLISTGLADLGGLLRASDGASSIVGKGVESVRSKVGNLAEMDWVWDKAGKERITHDSFIEAVVKSFQEGYDVEEMPTVVEEDEETMSRHIRDGIAELKEWDWAYGQTPEFTYSVHRMFGWGEITAEIHSKSGIIISCTLNGEGAAGLRGVAELLTDRRYAFVGEELDEELLYGREEKIKERMKETWRWLARELDN